MITRPTKRGKRCFVHNVIHDGPCKRDTRVRKVLRQQRTHRFQWALRKIWAANVLWKRLEMKRHIDERFE